MNHNNRLLAVVCIVIIISTVGCVRTPSASGYEVDFDGAVEVDNSQFRMNGQVEADLTPSPLRHFRDIEIVLYTEDRDVIERYPVGTISTRSGEHPLRRSVNVSTPELPAYVVLESPDFSREDTSVVAFRLSDGEYLMYYVENQNEKFS